MFYSPFIDSKGYMKSLDKVSFKDILKLESNQIEEGYNVEYKSQWDDNFKKKHLCKVIVSFANAGGGWFIIGVEDGTGKYIGINKERADFSQTISQKLVSEVSPLPVFECRFIHETNNQKKGVLVIHVWEGINPPYVCAGTVYTRCGSSKIPIRSERSAIDEMINRRNQYEKVIKDFCVNKYTNGLSKYPYVTIYFYNQHSFVEKTNHFEKRKIIKEYFDKEKLQKYQDSFNSVISINSKVVRANIATSIEEYFEDGCIKLHMPFFQLNEKSVEPWINEVKNCNPDIDLHEMKIVEGMYTYMILFSMICRAIRYIQKYEKNLHEYKIVFEFNNTNGMVFYHRHNFEFQKNIDDFRNKMKNGKVNVCYLSELKTDPGAFRKESCGVDAETLTTELLYRNFLPLFGIDADFFSEILGASEGKYNESVFSSENYEC